MYNIENYRIKVSVSEKGAELQSFFDKETGIEYMWNANPAFWAKHSPVLFPIVGTLKDNTYYFQGKNYKPKLRIRKWELKILRLIPERSEPFSSFFDERYFEYYLLIYFFKVCSYCKSSETQC